MTVSNVFKPNEITYTTKIYNTLLENKNQN